MRRQRPFVWLAEQPVDHAAGFATLRGAPVRRETEGVNRWVLARGRFDAGSGIDGELTITVDGKYAAWLNGKPLGRGPVRASPHFQRADRYAIAPCAGSNLLAVLIHVPGIDLASYEASRGGWQPVFGDGGLYADVSLQGVPVDLTWRLCEATAWRRDAARSGWGQDFIEDYDARCLDPDWILPDFSDAHWTGAREMLSFGSPDETARGFGLVEPFTALIPSQIPHPEEAPVFPARLLWARRTGSMPGLPVETRLYCEDLGAEAGELVSDGDALLRNDDDAATVRTLEGVDIALMLAFDPYHAGRPFIELDARGGEVVEIAVAESLPGEFGRGIAGDGLRHEGHLGVSQIFRYVARPGRQRFDKFNWTAVRAMQIVVRNAPDGIAIRRVGSMATHYPARPAGGFECSDPLLTRLWATGRYTVLQCMHDAWVDCPGREARQWIGDAVVQFDIAALCFGPSVYPLQRQFLDHVAESQRADGLARMFAPGDISADALVIPDFSLLWIIALERFHRESGDSETVERVMPGVERALAWFERHLGVHDLLVDVPHWHFIEWANLDRRGESAAINALYCGALDATARLAGIGGRSGLSRRCRELRGVVARALNARHWDEARGAYVDSVSPVTGEQGRRVSQHANALAMLFDVAPRDRWPAILKRITDEGRLKLTAAPPIVPDGMPFDEGQDVVRANSFFSHFVYDGIIKAGGFAWVLQDMGANYGPMLESGATTLWESFTPNASLCHGFSATPTFQMSRHCLGVSPLAPGYEVFAIAPEVGGLSWARGTVETLSGPIKVEWSAERGRMELLIVHPDGLRMEIPERTDRRLVSKEGTASGVRLVFDLL